MTEGPAHITVQAYESKELGWVGDGAAAWNALTERFDGNTKDVRRLGREKPCLQVHEARWRLR